MHLSVADVPDHRDRFHPGETAVHLQAEVVHRGFRIVEKDELLHAEAGELAAELAADGAGGACHEYRPVFTELPDTFDVEPYLLASEKVLDLDLADIVFHDPPADDLIDGRGDQDLDPIVRAELDERILFLLGFFLRCKQNAIERETVENGR